MVGIPCSAPDCLDSELGVIKQQLLGQEFLAEPVAQVQTVPVQPLHRRR